MALRTQPWIIAAGLCIVTTLMAAAQQPPVLKARDRDGGARRALTDEEQAALGDPFFNLVLKEHPEMTSLKDLENQIQPDAAKRKVFVVDETIRDPRKGVGQSRRSVLAFQGQNMGQTLENNLMISVFFNENGISDTPGRIEVWGWDGSRGRYNYYVMEQGGWDFRGSSVNADLLTQEQREGTCMACHINGGPVMKELLIPWNNWHSFRSLAAYLLPTSSATVRWPVADTDRLKGRLGGAEELETLLIPALGQFNARRIRANVRQQAEGGIELDANGCGTVLDGQRLLKPLFATTEFNLISSQLKSGLHPLPNPNETGPSAEIDIPGSFFLNAHLLGTANSALGLSGLGIARAREFGGFKVKPEEYKKLVKDRQIKLGGAAGDADFAWFVPEPSLIDNDLVDQLIQQGVVTPQFVAAVAAIDLKTPVFSQKRESLLRFIPREFRFKPRGEGMPVSNEECPDGGLTSAVKAAIQAAAPPAGSPEAEFLALLSAPDALGELKQRVEAYHAEVSGALGNETTRAAELTRLFQLAIDRRQAIRSHPSSAIVESQALLPLP